MNKILNNIVLMLLLFCTWSLSAQINTLTKKQENNFIEAKWKYTYTVHLESNTIIHKADEGYGYYLYLKYDYSYQQFLNGKESRGAWSLNDRNLFYDFRNINKFYIAEARPEIFVLQFSQPNSKGNYQYHFVRVETKDAPFVKPFNELPDVDIEARRRLAKAEKKKTRKSWWERRRERKRLAEEAAAPAPLARISVELVGGGYYGGIDPILRDYVQIKPTGRLIKEFKSVNRGLVVTRKDISRDELEQFMEFVVSKGFFDYERMYNCETEICQARKRKKPTPIPLRLVIAYGNRKKVVTVPIWGLDDTGIRYISYPRGLEEIIKAIQQMANRYEAS